MRNSIVVIFTALAFVAACGGDKSGGSNKIPPKPINGSPIGAEFVKFGKDRDGKPSVKVHLYNFGDKPAVAYTFLLRYFDASGKILRVKPGTPFEKDTDFMSQSGNKYKCDPKKHKTLDIEMLNVPEGATKAEVLVTMVKTTPDGMKIEDWWKQERWSEWPESGAAPAAADPKAAPAAAEPKAAPAAAEPTTAPAPE